jgi:two-component system nitrogen regulation response regulator GlnG
MPTERASSSAARIWVVDDDRAVRFVLAEALRDAGYRVQAFDGAQAALDALRTETPPELVFTDVRMPGVDGLAFLDALMARDPALPVVVMSAYTDVASTAGAFRGGAREFLSKPFDLDEAVALAERSLPPARRASATAGDASPPEAAAGASDAPGTPAGELLGDAPPMRALFRAIGRLAQAPIGVLITGETGTGKELVARALHRESPRAHRPFVALNTAAIPAELLESELFGHEAGAFTGATRRHVGRFEQADGGTLFLDEIGDMPAALQTRLLRVLAEGEFFRVGGRELIRVDVRVLAATHQDLAQRVADGRFRADLYHRLNVVQLGLPALRERKADLPMLVARFLADAARRLGSPVKRLQPEALRRLEQHDWPGNVRELENLCWRIAALAPGASVSAAELKALFQPSAGAQAGDGEDARWTAPLAAAVAAALARGEDGLHARLRDRFDQVLLETALVHTDGHRQEAARRLGLGRNTVTRKLGAARPRTTPRKPE